MATTSGKFRIASVRIEIFHIYKPDLSAGERDALIVADEQKNLNWIHHHNHSLTARIEQQFATSLLVECIISIGGNGYASVRELNTQAEIVEGAQFEWWFEGAMWRNVTELSYTREDGNGIDIELHWTLLRPANSNE